MAGITSNLSMKGIPVTKKERAVKDSIINLNYIFTVSVSMIDIMIDMVLFSLYAEKKNIVSDEPVELLVGLKST